MSNKKIKNKKTKKPAGDWLQIECL